MRKTSFALCLLALAAWTAASIASAGAAAPPKAKLPVLTTSAGQSQDVTTVNIVLEEAGLTYDYCDVPTPEIIAAGVGLGGRESREGFHAEVYTDTAKYPRGTPYKTVIFAIGASMKGMGASGLTVDSEEARLKKAVEYCKKNKILVVAVHVGGKSTRGPKGSDHERMIDVVAPSADYIIVTKESNTDGRFSAIAKAKNIPLTEIEAALDMVELMKKLFQP